VTLLYLDQPTKLHYFIIILEVAIFYLSHHIAIQEKKVMNKLTSWHVVTRLHCSHFLAFITFFILYNCIHILLIQQGFYLILHVTLCFMFFWCMISYCLYSLLNTMCNFFLVDYYFIFLLLHICSTFVFLMSCFTSYKEMLFF
jgi:hypothetical protein